MSALAYYNEIDPYAAAWLRNLIAAGHIAPGEVDERSIADVRPDDLLGYVQCHFFAGIGVWSYALRRAGWGDDRPVWTGSCPCQPFSAAGRGEGFADERHLWPAFHHLIAQRRPPVVFGEQVASKAVDPWIDLVQADLEGLGYAFGCVPFPSSSVGAPHIRDRAYFVAHAGHGQRDGVAELRGPERDRCHAGWSQGGGLAEPRGNAFGLADADGARVRDQGRGSDAGAPRRGEGERHQRERLRHDARHDDRRDGDVADAAGARPQGSERSGQRPDAQLAPAERAGTAGGMADSSSKSSQRIAGSISRSQGQVGGRGDHGHRPGGAACVLADAALGGRGEERPHAGGLALGDRTEGVPAGSFAGGGNQRPGPTNGFWRDPDWLHCRDGRWRPVEPGTFPLAHGAPARVGRLRAYGNAINGEAAAAFIAAAADAMGVS